MTAATQVDCPVLMPLRPTHDAVERAMRRSAAVWAALWIVGISFAISSQVASLRWPWIAVLGLAAVTAAWLLWIKGVVTSAGLSVMQTVTDGQTLIEVSWTSGG